MYKWVTMSVKQEASPVYIQLQVFCFKAGCPVLLKFAGFVSSKKERYSAKKHTEAFLISRAPDQIAVHKIKLPDSKYGLGFLSRPSSFRDLLSEIL